MERINHEYYVSLEVAKLLKEVGFDWECTALYGIVYYLKGTKNIVHPDAYSLGEMDTVLEDKLIFGNYKNSKYCNTGCAAPTLSGAQRWLRENKDFDINIITDLDSVKRLYYVRYIVKDGHYKTYYITNNQSYVYFDTYEEAQEAGIKKALEIIFGEGRIR